MDIPMEVDFVDNLGDKWTNFRVVAPEAKKWLEANGIECPVKHARDFSVSAEEANKQVSKLLPKHFVTSDQVDYMKGIELQAAIQKHIDHSISRTINLPKGTKPETVSEVYKHAWRLGLKGVTVYVDGSRDGVLIADSSSKKDKDKEENSMRPEVITESHAPKRPKSLPADIHHVKVKGVDWGVVVGLFDGRPYEVFAGRGLELPTSKEASGAHIIRSAQKKYKFKYFVKGNGEKEIGNLTEIYDTPEERVITRSVCRELRHGIPVEFIIRDLQDHKGSITDYSSALARVLKKYVQRASLLAKVCPACGGTDFVMQEGCAACKDCGSSKCG
jgi:ribonucleoside-diphosphate reductase alpha chain